MDGIVQENGQNNLSPVESNLCCNFQPPTEQTDETPRGDSNDKWDIDSEKKDISTIVQLTPLNPGELCIKPTCGQSLTMPVVHPEQSMPNYTNFSTILFSGQTPTNTLNTKLTSVFSTPTQCFGQVRNPLASIVPIVKGSMQSTVAASTRIPMETFPVMSGNVCSKVPITCFLPTRLSSTRLSHEQPVPNVHYQPKTRHVSSSYSQTRKQPCFTTTKKAYTTTFSTLGTYSFMKQVKTHTESYTATAADSQCMYTSTGSGNQYTETGFADTQLQQAPVPCALLQPGKPTEATDLVPELQSGRVDAKKFRPRHYDIDSLEIGTWRYQHKMFSSGKSRLKVIFTQRKFVYELHINSAADNSQVLVSIETPFRTVVGLNISTSPTVDVIMEVDTVPAMWQGQEVVQQRRDGTTRSRIHYNTIHTVDLTDGQLSKVPYHKLTLSSSSIEIGNHLMNFDQRFSTLLKMPFQIDYNKPPPAGLKLEKSSKRRKRNQDLSDESPVHDLEPSPKSQRWFQTSDSLKVCCCTSGCTSQRCSCIREQRKCQDCSCVSCDNPLNILEEFGVNLAEACSDSCLMQNLPKVNNLRTFLQNTSVATPCCDSLIPTKNCCTGVVECPECDSKYRFSWCSRNLCHEDNCPRNHCSICLTCRDYRDQHCPRCNRCYFAGCLNDFPCPCRGVDHFGRSTFML